MRKLVQILKTQIQFLNWRRRLRLQGASAIALAGEME
jgi:hypothetical protein